MSVASESHPRKPILGCIADDVTGATDLALNLVHGGMKVIQVLQVPDSKLLVRLVDVDAIVVALKIRSVCKEDAVDAALHALHALQTLGIPRFYFKYCSTFDSTPQGNIGPVAEALMQDLELEQTIFCPAFPQAGRTVYQGHLFVGKRLLNESGMQHHPLNPMGDANLVRVLSKQTSQQVGLLAVDGLRGRHGDASDRLASLARQKVPMVVADACDEQDLATLASAVSSLPLVTGGSGLARHLPLAYRETGLLRSEPYLPALEATSGRCLIVAGSCSEATNAQVEHMKQRCHWWALDVAAVIQDAAGEMKKLSAWLDKRCEEPTLLISSTAPPADVARIQSRFGANHAAVAVERFLGSITRVLVERGNVRRLILAGGETSGAIVRALGIEAIQIGPEICTGVPWTETVGYEPPLAVALKSGNFGEEDFFQTALQTLP